MNVNENSKNIKTIETLTDKTQLLGKEWHRGKLAFFQCIFSATMPEAHIFFAGWGLVFLINGSCAHDSLTQFNSWGCVRCVINCTPANQPFRTEFTMFFPIPFPSQHLTDGISDYFKTAMHAHLRLLGWTEATMDHVLIFSASQAPHPEAETYNGMQSRSILRLLQCTTGFSGYGEPFSGPKKK